MNYGKYGPGEGLIFLDEVDCDGSESSLLECRAHELGVHNCYHGEDAGVICPCVCSLPMYVHYKCKYVCAYITPCS